MEPIVHYGEMYSERYHFLQLINATILRIYDGRIDGTDFDGWPDTDFTGQRLQFVYDHVGDQPAIILTFDDDMKRAHGHVVIGTIKWSTDLERWLQEANARLARSP